MVYALPLSTMGRLHSMTVVLPGLLTMAGLYHKFQSKSFKVHLRS